MGKKINVSKKGKTGEREIFNILSEKLGIKLERNLDQTRGGGCDSGDLPGFAIEVKRCETLAIKKWWEQAVEQAIEAGRQPVLFFRQNRKSWECMIDISLINKCVNGTMRITVDTFCDIYKQVGHGC